jgi:hypothetical protein
MIQHFAANSVLCGRFGGQQTGTEKNEKQFPVHFDLNLMIHIHPLTKNPVFNSSVIRVNRQMHHRSLIIRRNYHGFVTDLEIIFSIKTSEAYGLCGLYRPTMQRCNKRRCNAATSDDATLQQVTM